MGERSQDGYSDSTERGFRCIAVFDSNSVTSRKEAYSVTSRKEVHESRFYK